MHEMVAPGERMITVYGSGANADKGQRPAESLGVWIELIEPAQDDIASASKLAGIDEKLIHDALDLHERPRIEVDDESTLLVIRAPHAEDGNNGDRYSTVPLGIIRTGQAVVAVCKIRDEALCRILENGRALKHRLRTERSVCSVCQGVALLFLLLLKDISAKIREVERDLARSLSNDDLTQLLNLQKAVTYFHAALKTNDFILDRLLRKGLSVGSKGRLVFNEDEADVLDDAVTDTRQGIYMSKIFTEVLNSITAVYSSVISNSVNRSMKTLTSLTVILMIPTLLTSMYGMNIDLPLQGHPGAFVVVGGVSAAITTAVIWIMKRSRLL